MGNNLKDYRPQTIDHRQKQKKLETSLTDYAKEQINIIHAKSVKLNELRGKVHNEVLLELVREHAKEITELYKEKNPHYLTETGDLLILCLELLREAGMSADEIMEKCYQRYHKKLEKLI
ncbi:MAG: hypothetical protein ABII88_09295 [Candidatus Omnitrophota bacterium]